MLEGYDQAREIAAFLGIDVREVYKAMRRLDRKVASVRKRMANREQTEEE
jgi:DNA-binding CsgD family transcriptional regulator